MGFQIKNGVLEKYTEEPGVTVAVIPDSVTDIGEYAFSFCKHLINIVIPNGVTSIGESAFSYCSSLTSVNIPNGVTSIGAFAFFNCSSLTSVNIPNSVTSIGESAFYYCSSLTSVNIPNGVTSIGAFAFFNCSSLTSVNIPESLTSIGASAFSSCSSLTSVNIPNGVTSIGESVFSDCSALESITIPDSVTSIGESAFHGCSSLTSVNIPNSVTSIGESAFHSCISLKSVNIPNSIVSIGRCAFSACGNVKFTISEEVANRPQNFAVENGALKAYRGPGGDVIIPNNVTSIGESAFHACSSLTSVNIPNSVTSIGRYAFSACSSLTSVIIPKSVTRIGEYAFCGCSNLISAVIPDSVMNIGRDAFSACGNVKITISEEAANRPQNFAVFDGRLERYCGTGGDVIIPDSVVSIGKSAFLGCSSLTSVKIPSSVTSIGIEAFSGCQNLTHAMIPDSVTSIGESAFSGCSSLTSVNIPNSVTSIVKSAFSYCSSLTSVIIPNSVKSIGACAFSGCSSLTSVIIPNNVTDIGESAFHACSSLTSVNIPNSVTRIVMSAFSGCSSLTSVNIPNSVTSIGESVFSYCSALKSITIPESVTSIGESAFHGCSSLTSVNIPNSVKNIGAYAFSGCSSLTSVMIPDSVASIGYDIFKNCGKINFFISEEAANKPQNFAIENGTLMAYRGPGGDVVVPEGVTSIGVRAFSGRSILTGVTLPKGVISVGENAFADCYRLSSLSIQNEKCKFSKEPFGDRYPIGLLNQVSELYPHMTDASLKKYLLDKKIWSMLPSELQAEIFLARQGKTLTAGYIDCITEEQIEPLGKMIAASLASGKPSAKFFTAAVSYMTMFKEKVPAETLQNLYSAMLPVKAADKALKTIDDDLVLKEKLGLKLTVNAELPPVEKLVMETMVAEKLSLKDLEEKLKNCYSLALEDLPKVKSKEGTDVDQYVFAWLLTAHEKVEKHLYSADDVVAQYLLPGVRPEAQAVLDELDAESVRSALMKLADEYLIMYQNSKKKFLPYPICRYADGAMMSELTKRAPKWRTSVSGDEAPPLWQFRKANIYNNTREAMLFAEKYHELDEYAKLRGTDEETLRDTQMSELGMDQNGKKAYNLGSTVIEVALMDDLSLSLRDVKTGKTVKSIPKRNANPEEYEAAKADYTEIKKNAKKIAKARNKMLYEAFMGDKSYDAGNWKAVHQSNPLLNRIARLLVWEQENKTFTLSDRGATDSKGQAYDITGETIRLAHPMEMKTEDVTLWQKYFTSLGLKQPFEQIWEPVIDKDSISADRYEGSVLPLYRFVGKDKHGIISYGFFAYSEGYSIEFKDCDLELKDLPWRLDWDGGRDINVELGKFTFEKYTRYTNHIAGLLDKWTVSDRILKDDVSIIKQLDSFTLAQVMEFIKIATENKCANVTVALLEYKNSRFSDYDPMEEFTLDI